MIFKKFIYVVYISGLCKIDSEAKARKLRCDDDINSSRKDFGEEHEPYNVVLRHVKSQ